MSDYDAVFYYASGETADFPPPRAPDFYGLVADQLAPAGRADSVPVPTSLPKFVADGSIRGSSDGRGSGEESNMPVHLGKG